MAEVEGRVGRRKRSTYKVLTKRARLLLRAQVQGRGSMQRQEDHLSPRRFEAVSYSAECLQVARMAGIFLDLLP